MAEAEDTAGMTENLRKRRVSILKQPKSPTRSAFQDLDLNLQNDDTKTTRLSRRVSFAEKYQVKEFHTDSVTLGPWNCTELKPITGSDESSNGTASEYDNTKSGLQGIESLLSGKIHSESAIFSETEFLPTACSTQVFTYTAAQKRSFASEANLTDLISAPTIRKRSRSSSEDCDDVFETADRLKPESDLTDRTVYFNTGNEPEADMSLTQVHNFTSGGKISTNFFLESFVSVNKEIGCHRGVLLAKKSRIDSHENKENMCTIECDSEHEVTPVEQEICSSARSNMVDAAMQMDMTDEVFTEDAGNKTVVGGEMEMTQVLQDTKLISVDHTILFDANNDNAEMEETESVPAAIEVDTGAIADSETIEGFSNAVGKTEPISRGKSILPNAEVKVTERVPTSTELGERGTATAISTSLRVESETRRRTILFENGDDMEMTDVLKPLDFYSDLDRAPVLRRKSILFSAEDKNAELEETECIASAIELGPSEPAIVNDAKVEGETRRRTILFQSGEDMEITEVLTRSNFISDYSGKRMAQKEQASRRKSVLPNAEMEETECVPSVIETAFEITNGVKAERDTCRGKILSEDGDDTEMTDMLTLPDFVEGLVMSAPAVNTPKSAYSMLNAYSMQNSMMNFTFESTGQLTLESTQLLLRAADDELRGNEPEGMDEFKDNKSEEADEFKGNLQEKMYEFKSTKPDEMDEVKSTKPDEMDEVKSTKPDEMDELKSNKSEEADEHKGIKPDEMDELKSNKPEEAVKLEGNEPEEMDEFKSNKPGEAVKEPIEMQQEGPRIRNDGNVKCLAKGMNEPLEVLELKRQEVVELRKEREESASKGTRKANVVTRSQKLHTMQRDFNVDNLLMSATKKLQEMESSEGGKVQEAANSIVGSVSKRGRRMTPEVCKTSCKRETETPRQRFQFLEFKEKLNSMDYLDCDDNPEDTASSLSVTETERKLGLEVIQEMSHFTQDSSMEMLRPEEDFTRRTRSFQLQKVDNESSAFKKPKMVRKGAIGKTVSETPAKVPETFSATKSKRSEATPDMSGSSRKSKTLKTTTPVQNSIWSESVQKNARISAAKLAAEMSGSMKTRSATRGSSSSILKMTCSSSSKAPKEHPSAARKELKYGEEIVEDNRNAIDESNLEPSVIEEKTNIDDGNESPDVDDCLDIEGIFTLLEIADGILESADKAINKFDEIIEEMPSEKEMIEAIELEEKITAKEAELEKQKVALKQEQDSVLKLREEKHRLENECTQVQNERTKAEEELVALETQIIELKSKADLAWEFREGQLECTDDSGFTILYLFGALAFEVVYGDPIPPVSHLDGLPAYAVKSIILRQELDPDPSTPLANVTMKWFLDSVKDKCFVEMSPTTYELYKCLNEVSLANYCMRMLVENVEKISFNHDVEYENDHKIRIKFVSVKQTAIFSLVFTISAEDYPYKNLYPSFQPILGDISEKCILDIVAGVKLGVNCLFKITNAIDAFLGD